MTTFTTDRRRLAALTFALTAALATAACGSDDAASDTTAAPVGTDAPTGTDMTDADMDMNMGDADATPADDVAGAALARGEFALLDSRPSGYDDLAGTAVIARHGAGTTVTTELTGLLPNVEYVSHVHAEPCASSGGPHYQFELGGSDMPPNEIHLAFTSDDDGNGFMTAENHAIAGIEAVAFVVHPVEFIDNKLACVDFVEDTDGAAAAALDAGLSADHADTDDMDDDDMDELDDMEDPEDVDS